MRGPGATFEAAQRRPSVKSAVVRAHPRPAPRHVATWQDAETLAADWMRYLGYVDAAVTPPGRDGGIDVRASRAVAQVKFKVAHVGAPELQQLFGARGQRTDQELLFFTRTSYSSPAREYASRTGIALFNYDADGRVSPVNTVARHLFMKAAAREPAERTPAEESTAGRGAGDADLQAAAARPVDDRQVSTTGCLGFVVAFVLLFAGIAAAGMFDELLNDTSGEEVPPGMAAAVGLSAVVFYGLGVVGLVAVNRTQRRRSPRAAAWATFWIAAPVMAAFAYGGYFSLAVGPSRVASDGVLSGGAFPTAAAVLSVPVVVTFVSSWRRGE